jgi:hypothetical protein
LIHKSGLSSAVRMSTQEVGSVWEEHIFQSVSSETQQIIKFGLSCFSIICASPPPPLAQIIESALYLHIHHHENLIGIFLKMSEVKNEHFTQLMYITHTRWNCATYMVLLIWMSASGLLLSSLVDESPFPSLKIIITMNHNLIKLA